MKRKERLDILVVEKKLAKSREHAKAMIMAGKVLVDGIPKDKAGLKISPDSKISVKGDNLPFVSRGGIKLDHAIKNIPVNIKDMICLDIGASTGGFTDCLLQNGAKKVYAVDVGYGQLAWSLRQDKRVEVIERTNIRYMDFNTIGEKVDIITIDTSFISLKLVIPAAEKFMKKGTKVLALIKPQFEAGKERIGKGGIVRDENLRQDIINEIKSFFKQRGYDTGQIIESPIKGAKGNIEFIIFLRYQGNICSV